MAPGRVYKPLEEIDVSNSSQERYLVAEVKAPRLTGLFLRIAAMLLECRLLAIPLAYVLKKANMVHEFFSDARFREPPMFSPHYLNEDIEEQGTLPISCRLPPPERLDQAMGCLPEQPLNSLKTEEPFFYRWSIRDFSNAYTSGQTTPLKVAKNFLSAVEDLSKNLKMAIFINCNSHDILKQAAESTARYERGVPLSILDGIPIAVKDEIDCLPYPTTGGTTWMSKLRKVESDADCVRQLRDCGAVLVGKTNMHEFGVGTSGINPHYGAVRNPYNPGRVSGGSSSGSAAAVCAGLCPVALGVDGGGSVRLPAALCGVIGLKPTFGCISHSGVLPLNWTLGMIGIIATTTEDALITYAALYSRPVSDHLVSIRSIMKLPNLRENSSVGDIKVAIYPKWFDDCDEAISNVCHDAVDLLRENHGLEVVEVTLPEIEEMRLAHYITIGSEFASSMGSYMKEGLQLSGWDARFAFGLYRSFDSKEYLNAQRLRFRQMHHHMNIFKKADVIVTPTTGVTAYAIKEDALTHGEIDYVNGAALVRYMVSANFLGLPAITIPVGYDKFGLPIGLQFIGSPWSEALLMRLAYATEALFAKFKKRPVVYYDILSGEKL